jgi:hypothetical protein
MSTHGKTLDDILAELETESQEKTAEEKLAEGLSEDTVEEEVIEESTEEDTKETPEDDEEKTAEEIDKVAEEMDVQGRSFARAFVDELQKIAVGTGPYTGNSADTPASAKSVNHLSVGELPEAGKVDAVIAKLKELTAATEASVPSIEIDTNSQPAPRKAPDETAGTIAADSALAVTHQAALPSSAGGVDMGKQAADEIVNTIYDTFFTEGEE